MRTVEEFINEYEDKNWKSDTVTKRSVDRKTMISLIKEYSKEVIDEIVEYCDDYFDSPYDEIDNRYTGDVIPIDYEIMKLKNDL